MDELNLEKQKLADTIEIIKRLITANEKDLAKFTKESNSNDITIYDAIKNARNHIRVLNNSIDSPYFARIDFYSEDEKTTNVFYIGKNGIIENEKIIVTDWRAPISSLYYNAEVGSCSYPSPSGNIYGRMDLKRQFEISKGELLNYFDVDLVSSDMLLQKYLKANNNSRLKSIVSTIQKEQNDVIRKSMGRNLIVQGVAGSGKTTVALHRIAYLIYNNIYTTKNNQYLVIGPNSVFLKYIESVLPDLDVSGVSQKTFETFAQDYIEEQFNINNSSKKVSQSISGKYDLSYEKTKCSLEYKECIEKFINLYIEGICKKDIFLGGLKVIDKNVVLSEFNDSEGVFTRNLKSRIDYTITRLCMYAENNQSLIMDKYNDYAFRLFNTAKTEKEKEKLRNQFLKERQEIKTNLKNTIRKYFSTVQLDVKKLYKLFINNIEKVNSSIPQKDLELLKKSVLDNIKNDSYDYEDLAAMVYIKYLVNPKRDYENIKHIIVDEAQDLGEFNFFTLKTCMPNATFSVFGDIAQSIYDYRSIDNWDELNSKIFNGSAEVVNFNKSYRTTAEIMNAADSIATSIGYGSSEDVVRHGEPVRITRVEDQSDIPSLIVSKVEELKSKGHKTIGIISKTDLLCKYLRDDFNDINVSYPILGPEDNLLDSENNVCMISNQLAKGLEFDAVIINNASSRIYSADKALDMKLLYVAITRALHEVEIIYEGELPEPLSRLQLEEGIKPRTRRE